MFSYARCERWILARIGAIHPEVECLLRDELFPKVWCARFTPIIIPLWIMATLHI